jgi:hypothetical protein
MEEEKIRKPFLRINSRATEEQIQYIKNRAIQTGKSEGEVHREIINYFIAKHK